MSVPSSNALPASEMQLRDVFAAHIVGALLMAPKLAGVPRMERDAVARQAFELADALLKERDR